ncbi:uncharacterized protein LY89DRAFT_169006 [Mollisia scopiformis]|uniref:Uncharacterized protein n=1 Tax=Mollisia scopiformis TaxID=149040 RepID=A0A194XS69_MOLSC|nr:uncharacterized protein LY89DRAFT_169006 [Mollisia scopiformis]KUJ23145.1 hypothetical protein LY89DRAFT_169006 [Mollisia scopiformis]
MAVWKHHEQATVKLEGALKDSKELRLAVQNFDEVSKQKQDLITVNSKLLADKELCEQNLKALETQLQEAKLQHSNEQASLAAEIADLHADAKQNLKSYQLLQNELNERLTELQREKHNSEKLLKNLDEQTAKWGQLLELAKQIPKDTAEVLNGEDGKLATILSSKNTTQEKIEEMTSMIEELVNCERELPPTLVKLVEDVALRLEGEKQLSDGNGNILRDTAATISQELQEGLNQLRLDKEAEIRLKSKIAELEQVRESLNADKSARDTEVDNLLRQLNETERELSSCRSDLSNKTNELTVALNAPRDDPVLQSKISELEKINNLLDDETKKMSQELSKAKEELSSIRKTAANKEEEKNVLAQTLISAQQTIKNFEQEMAKTLALKDEEHKKKYQDLARNGESQKATIKMKLEAEVKTLESRVTERNTEIDSLKEQLQRLPSEANQRTADLEAEVASYKEQILQLIPQLKRLEQDKPSNWDSVGFSGELRSAQNELADLRLLFQSATTETTRILEVATKEQRAIEDALRRFDESQKKISAGAASQSLEQPNLNARDGISRSDRRLDSSSIMLSSSRISGPKHTKFASTEDDAGEKFWTPTLLPRGPVERLGGASIHSVQQQNHALDSHALRVAPRKNNWIESSTRFANKPDINTLQPPGKNHDSDMLQVTADRTPISYESSPLSDLSSMFDDFGSTNDQVEVHKEYETRSKRDNGLAAPRSAFAQQTVLDLTQQSSSIGEIQGSNHQPTHSVMAKANALSHAEESHRRRNAQLPKSALKKPIRSSDILPQPSMASEGRGDSARETGFRNNKTMGPPQRTDRPLVNFKGVVSGNSARSMTSVGRESSSALTYGTSDASHFFDLQHSPPMDAPKRNRSKRLASARLESDKTKVSRISFPSRLSSQSVIADSQADSQDSEYN